MIRRSLPLALLALSACDGIQSVTGGDGFHGRQFNTLFTIFLAITLLFFLLVMAGLVAAILRRRRGASMDRLEEGEPSREGLMRPVLIGWAALILLGLTVLTFASYLADADSAAKSPEEALQVEIVANQWWWDIKYHDPNASNVIRTANELHLPVGVPVHIQLKSADVIHSFWVPNLAGKQDLIPGRVNDILLIARNEGVYRGQCAEYCGIQHAHMALDVTVESRGAFNAWRRAQLAPAARPTTALAQAGYQYFMDRECSACHNISGTQASGQIAPDLTHVASRRSIAAGTLPMNRGNLYAWIADPQGPKPGNNMPYIGLESTELHALAAYLETLK
jgi:cytochrome c oxidase subunit II